MALLESHEVDWLQALEPEIAGWLQLSAGRLRSLAAVDREAISELRSLVDSYEERRAAAATACDAAEQGAIGSSHGPVGAARVRARSCRREPFMLAWHGGRLDHKSSAASDGV